MKEKIIDIFVSAVIKNGVINEVRDLNIDIPITMGGDGTNENPGKTVNMKVTISHMTTRLEK